MVLGDPKTCVYLFIFDINDINDANTIQYFILNRLGLCIKIDTFVARMLYVWLFSNNIAIPIAMNNNKDYIYLNAYTTVFAWGYVNSNKIKHKN